MIKQKYFKMSKLLALESCQYLIYMILFITVVLIVSPSFQFSRLQVDVSSCVKQISR